MGQKLEYTAIGQIAPAYEKVRATFLSGVTRPLEYRKHQMKQLGFLIQENEPAFIAALESDLGRPAFETIIGELNPLKGEINEFYAKLDKWAKPRKVKTQGLWNFASAMIYPEPKGVALVIGAWNYPITLLLGPLLGAISAGCTAIVKPSENCPQTAALMASLFPKYMDTNAYQVVNGAVEETTELLRLRYDHVFYTGSGTVGRIVARAAAEHLTPVTLELGGKSPACVFDDADIASAGKRIMWGKYANSGQVCISPDYVLVEAHNVQKLIASFKAALAEFVPEASPGLLSEDASFCKIVNAAQFKRLEKLLGETKGNVVIGGKTNPESNRIEVTVVEGVTADDSLMKGEVFGPILPILIMSSKEEMVEFIKARDNPLALYVFSKSKANRDFIFNNTRSGTFVQNDVLVQFAIPGLPFGGHGQSGNGNYHGKYSFDTFSHERASANVPPWFEALLASRYPPYNASKLKMILMASGEVIKRPSKYPGLAKSVFRLALVLLALVGIQKGRALL